MKKFIAIMLISGMLVSGFGGLECVFADVLTDTFQITITVSFISINLLDQSGSPYGTWAIGNVAGSSNNVMDSNNGGVGDEGIQVDNTSNTQIDLFCYATNTASWTLNTTIGEDNCILQAAAFGAWQAGPNPDMSTNTTILSESSPGEEVDSDVAADTDSYWYYQLDAPSSVSSGSENTFTVTIRAAAG